MMNTSNAIEINNTNTIIPIKKRINVVKKKQIKRKFMIRRLIAVIILTFTIFGLFKVITSDAVTKRVVKVFTPVKYMKSLPTKEIPTSKFDNKYFYDFIYSLDVADEFDSRDLLQYVMELNNIENVDEYYNYSSLIVPIPNK